MSVLTWRNVDAPDFRGAVDGIRAFGEMLGRGTDAGSTALGNWDDAITDNDSRQLMTNLLTKYQGSPDQLNADAASGKLLEGYDPTNLSDAALGLLAQRPKDLQAFAQGTADLKKTDVVTQGLQEDNKQNLFLHAAAQDDRSHFVADRSAVEAARPLVTLAAQAAGDKAGTAEGVALSRAELMKHPELLAKLPDGGAGLLADPAGYWAKVQNVRQTEAGIRGTNASTAGQLLQNQVGKWNFDVAKEDRVHETQAQATAQQILTTAPDKETALAQLAAAKLNPRAFTFALAHLESRFPGIVGADPSGQAAGIAAGASGSGAQGAMPQQDFIRALESSGGQANARNPNSSATGADQFTDKTWMDTVRQEKPAWAQGLTDAQILQQRLNPTRSGEMETALRAKNINALRNAGVPITNPNVYALHHFGQDAGVRFAKADNNTPIDRILSPGQIAANKYLKGMNKQQVLENWGRRSGDPTIAGGLGANPAFAAGAHIAFAKSRSEASNIGPEWLAAADDKRSMQQVINDLKTTGEFKGVPDSYLMSQLSDISNRTGGKPAQSAAILIKAHTAAGDKHSLSQVSRNIFDILPSFIRRPSSVNLANGTRVNGDQVEQYINQVRNGAAGGAEAGAVESNHLGNAGAEVVQAQATYMQAQQAYAVAANRYRNGDVRQASVLPRLQAARDQAYQNFLMVNGAAGPAGDTNPAGQPYNVGNDGLKPSSDGPALIGLKRTR